MSEENSRDVNQQMAVPSAPSARRAHRPGSFNITALTLLALILAACSRAPDPALRPAEAAFGYKLGETNLTDTEVPWQNLLPPFHHAELTKTADGRISTISATGSAEYSDIARTRRAVIAALSEKYGQRQRASDESYLDVPVNDQYFFGTPSRSVRFGVWDEGTNALFFIRYSDAALEEIYHRESAAQEQQDESAAKARLKQGL
jgi:hypothetical protein